MRKKILLTLVLIFAVTLLLAISTLAVDVTVNGITYALTDGATEAENTAQIKKHEGQTLTVTDIVIPEYVENNGVKYYVTSMANYCFKKTNITTVKFDDNCRISAIPTSAFHTCESLTLIDFGKAEIKTIGNQAFAYSRSLVFKDNKLPDGFTAFDGKEQFDCCDAMTTLVFPETFTYFNTDTRIQQSGIVNLIFKGEMTSVYLKYNKKASLGGMNVWLCKNTSDQLNGQFVETIIHDNAPHFKNMFGEITEKTSGTLTFALSSSDASSGTNATIDGVDYSRVNTKQDKIYFCGDNKVTYIVRTKAITGGWTGVLGYMATYEANALEAQGETNPNVTYKLIPHFAEKTVTVDANCLYPASKTVTCYCGEVMERTVLGTELGDHTCVDDFDCTTVKICTLCKDTIAEALSHCVSEKIEYASYFNNGNYTRKCTNDGCNALDVNQLTAPIFYWVGFSAKTFGEYGFGQQYIINTEALNTYKEVMSKNGITFSYGVVAAGGSSFGQPLSVVNGTVTARAGAEFITFDNVSYDAFFMNITGMGEGDLDISLVCCAYVQLGDDVVYLDDNNTVDTVTLRTYNEIDAIVNPKEDE